MDSKLVVEQMSGTLEDQAPRHEAAGRRGQPAGAVRARRSPGCRASGTSTPTGWPTRRSTACAATAGPAVDPACRAQRERPPRCPTPSTAAGPAAGHPHHVRCWCGTASPTTPRQAVLRRPWPAPTRGSTTRAGPRCGRPRSGWRRLRTGSTRSSARRSAAPGSPPRSWARCSARGGVEDGLAEMEFGAWDGLTFTEVRDRFPDEVASGWATWTTRRAAASRSARSRSGCWRAATGCSRSTTGRTVLAGQPRDADQDARRRRARRAAGVGVPDGALARPR